MHYENYDSFIMSESGSVCYLCDVENHDLIHLTRPGMEVYGLSSPEDYRGKKCYEVLQGRTSPCPFCNNCKLSQGKTVRWEHYNEKLGRWFDITDTLTEVNGRLCRLEIARDITARKDTQHSATRDMSMEDVLFRCLHILATEKSMDRAVNQFLATVGGYYQAARTYIFEFDREKGVTNNTFEWCGPGASREIDNLQQIPLEVVGDWISKFRSDGAFSISSVESERDPDSEEYRLLHMQGIHSLLAAPLLREQEIVGFIGVDDPVQNSGNPGLLRAVSEFVLAELERRRLMEELERVNFTDILTGVSNRNGYRKAVRELLNAPPESLGVLVLSHNGLKHINESFGQKYGDEIIIRTARKLQDTVQGQICRIGGDEFAVFCPDMSRQEFEDLVKKLQRSFLQEQDYSISLGWDWDNGGTDVNGQLLRAEEWMRTQKQRYYQDEITSGRTVGNSADDLFRDIENGCFTVYYQPQIDLRTGKVSGMEALVRKLDENGGIIPPGQFIPFYEARNILQHLDMHVLELVLRDLKKLKEQGLSIPASVNFSRSTMLSNTFAKEVCAKCRQYGIDPSDITVEVTETIADMSRDTLRRLLTGLRETGLKLSLDDFGTKYSNLAILTDVEFDEVKFDKTLVEDICTSGRNQIVLGRLMQMCRQLQQSRIVAEGIEDIGQVEILKSYGCDCGQGYYFHRPMPFSDLTQLLISKQDFKTAEVTKTSDSFLTGQDYALRYTLEEVLLRLINGGGDIYGYRIEGRRGLFSQQIARNRNVPEQLYDFPQWLLDHGQVAPGSTGDWLAMFSAIHRGDKHGSAKVSFRVDGDRFHQYYLRFNSFADEEGNPFFATISFENVEHENERARQQSQDITGLLQAIQKNYPEILTLNLTQNTYRMFSYHSGTTVGTPKEGCIDDMVALRVESVAEEDREQFRDMFNPAALHRSFVREGKEQLRFVYRRFGKDGEPVWFETVAMRQNNAFDQDVLLVAMSHSVDDQKAQELRMQEQLWLQAEELRVTTGRMRRTICFYDVVERSLTVPEDYAKAHRMPSVIYDYPESRLGAQNGMGLDAQKKVRAFYSAIQRGEPEGSCVVFSQHPEFGSRWKRWEFASVYDQKGQPRRAVIFVEDVTEQLAIQKRAEQDGMTGLLNRATTQERICRLMTEKAPGILIHIDLDDLKTINDTFGHGEGDKALRGIAQTLRQHFRDSDVVGRIGGDEFLVFLPGAAENQNTIAASVAALLRKLTVISVGAQEERKVHCSIGCAVQTGKEQSFDELYKQADMALYHVKRSGKNNFAFYSPEMEQADYYFKAQRLMDMRQISSIDSTELRYLPAAISDHYQLVLAMNLSTNSYFLMDEVDDGVFSRLPVSGEMDGFVQLVVQALHEEDREGFLRILSRENLLRRYEIGQTGTRYSFRFFDGENYRRTEAEIIFYTNDSGDVCDFTLVRWSPETE